MCVRPAGVLQGAWVVTDQLNPPQSACIIHAKHRACFLSPPPVLGPRMVWKRGLEQNLRSHYLPPPTLPPSVHSASQAPLWVSLGHIPAILRPLPPSVFTVPVCACLPCRLSPLLLGLSHSRSLGRYLSLRLALCVNLVGSSSLIFYSSPRLSLHLFADGGFLSLWV